MPAEAVTEEDAAKETGALPENAAAAARAVRDVMARTTAQQTRMAIPVQQDYFLPDDERREEGPASLPEDADIITDSGSDEDAEEVAEVNKGQDRAASGRAAGSSARQRGEDGTAGKKSSKAETNKRKRAPAPPAAGSGDDSDGYGEGGLSWEVVLQCIKVRWLVVGLAC